MVAAASAQSPRYDLVATLDAAAGKVQNLAFSPDGSMLVSGDRDGNIMLWSVEDRTLIRAWKGHEAIVVDFAFNGFGTKLATSSTDGSAKVWDVFTGELLGTYFNKQTTVAGDDAGWAVSFAVFSHDGRFLYFGGDGATLFRAKLGKDREGRTFPEEAIYTYSLSTFEKDKKQRITGGELLPSGQAIVCTIGYYAKVIQLADGAELQSMYYSPEALNDVVLGPQAGQVATWSYDGRVTIWNIGTGDRAAEFAAGDLMEICSPAFSPDRKLMATAAHGHEAHIWDLATRRQVATLMGHSAIVRIAKFSPAANLVATASYDGTVKLWQGPEMEIPASVPASDDMSAYNGDTTLNPEDLELPILMFDQSDYRLRKASSIALYRVAAIMKRHPDLAIVVEGHTDNVGNPYKNLNLSRLRAVVVQNFLIEQGIDEARVKIAAVGSDRPVFLNTSEASKSRNRRVELQFARL
jgi:WD40 repeat protein